MAYLAADRHAIERETIADASVFVFLQRQFGYIPVNREARSFPVHLIGHSLSVSFPRRQDAGNVRARVCPPDSAMCHYSDSGRGSFRPLFPTVGLATYWHAIECETIADSPMLVFCQSKLSNIAVDGQFRCRPDLLIV
jgi:hypothetical protein